MAKAIEEIGKPVKTLEERMLDFQERQLAIQEAAVAVQKKQLQQTAPKSNTAPPEISVYNPRGQKDFPMPVLKCDVWMPWQQTPTLHGMDREEVELMNLLEPGEYDIEMNNGDTERLVIVGQINRVNGKLERLTWTRGWDEDARQYTALFTHENRQYFPGLKNMLRQMLGEKAVGVLTIKEERRRTQLPETDPKHLAISLGA